MIPQSLHSLETAPEEDSASLCCASFEIRDYLRLLEVRARTVDSKTAYVDIAVVQLFSFLRGVASRVTSARQSSADDAFADLTHSFPSILQNTTTDVIRTWFSPNPGTTDESCLAAPYGFLFKPSTLWPPPPAEFQDRANKQTSLPGLKAAHEQKEAAREERKRQSLGSILRRTNTKAAQLAAATSTKGTSDPTKTNPQAAENTTAAPGHKEGTAEVAEILKVKIDGEEVEVRSQIQLYATNEQVRRPLHLVPTRG